MNVSLSSWEWVTGDKENDPHEENSEFGPSLRAESHIRVPQNITYMQCNMRFASTRTLLLPEALCNEHTIEIESLHFSLDHFGALDLEAA